MLSVRQAEIKGKADSIHSVRGVVLRHAHSKPRNKREAALLTPPNTHRSRGV